MNDCLDSLVLDAPVYLSAVTATGLILLVIWLLRHEPFFGRRHFLTTVIGMIIWLAVATFEMATPSLACKTAAATATWPAITLVPVSWSLFMWHYCFSVPQRWTRLETALVDALVLVISALALSNPWHGLFYGPETRLVMDGGRLSADFDHGPLFYAAAAFLYVFLVAGFVISVIASFRASRSVRPMMMILACGTAVPMATNLGYVVGDTSLFGFDPTPFAFSFVLLVLTWAIYANRGFDLPTLARDLLYFNLSDPVLVLNAQGQVAGANPAARRLMPQLAPGRSLDPDAPGELITRLRRCGGAGDAQEEVEIGESCFNMRVLPIPRPLGERGADLGLVAIMSDVTELKNNNAMLAEALDQSRRQLAEITRLRELAERSALSDPLTGIGNRRSLQIRFEAAGEAPLALALLDLDHFKAINDTLGHAVGDRVLRDFTVAVSRILPDAAEVFRVGGEEFVLLCPGMATQDIIALLARLNEALLEHPPLREHDHGRLTFSAGVATRPGDGPTFDMLYARADARLYHAKRSGRDRIMHVDSLPFDTDLRIEATSPMRRHKSE